MVCANISSPSKGAGGSSDASGGSFRHSWASCMLEVIHEDQPWESQVPPTWRSHIINTILHEQRKRCQEHVPQAVKVPSAYWFCPWVCMLSVGQWFQACSGQWQALPTGLSLLYFARNPPQSPEGLRVTPGAHLQPEKHEVEVINHQSSYSHEIEDSEIKGCCSFWAAWGPFYTRSWTTSSMRADHDLSSES